MRGRALIVSAAAMLAATGDAAAAEIAARGNTVRFTAAPGERNDVRAVASRGGVVVRDAGAALTAGDGCRRLAARRARCAGGQLVVDLADGADRFRGGGERDRVNGGDGADRLHGGGGFDFLIDRSAQDDVLRGGQGFDVVASFGGVDRLFGGASSDTLVAGRGAVVDAGADDDRVAVSRGPGSVDCGDGEDLVDPLGLGRVVPATCELFELSSLERAYPARAVRVDNRRVRVPVPELCGLFEPGTRCRVRVALFDEDEVVARATTNRGRIVMRAPAGARSVGLRYTATAGRERLAVRLRVVHRRR